MRMVETERPCLGTSASFVEVQEVGGVGLLSFAQIKLKSRLLLP